MTNTSHLVATRIRVDSPDVVELIAERNHAPLIRNVRAATVVLGDVTYFWAA